MVLVINYSSAHTALLGQVFVLMYVCLGDTHICASVFRLCMQMRQLAYVSTGDFQAHLFSLCCVSHFSLSLWAALTKLRPLDHKLFRACALHEVNPCASPFLCFVPSYSFFTPAMSWLGGGGGWMLVRMGV